MSASAAHVMQGSETQILNGHPRTHVPPCGHPVMQTAPPCGLHYNAECAPMRTVLPRGLRCHVDCAAVQTVPQCRLRHHADCITMRTVPPLKLAAIQDAPPSRLRIRDPCDALQATPPCSQHMWDLFAAMRTMHTGSMCRHANALIDQAPLKLLCGNSTQAGRVC
eukprot:365634-Chlamydomonas_euryale.AAC.18